MSVLWTQVNAEGSTATFSPKYNLSICSEDGIREITTSCFMEDELVVIWTIATREKEHKVALPQERRKTRVYERDLILARLDVLKMKDPIITRLHFVPHRFALPTTISCQPLTTLTTKYSRRIALRGKPLLFFLKQSMHDHRLILSIWFLLVTVEEA